MTASSWVTRWAKCVPSGSRVLDLASGQGRHARLFSGCGCKVTAVDREPSHGAALADQRNVHFVAADLERDAWPLGDAKFDAIVVTNYLHRPLFPVLHAALAPGGMLIYETFAAGNAAFGRPSNPDYLLNTHELFDVFSPHLRVLAFEDGFVAQPKPAMVQRLAARRVALGRALTADQCPL